MIEFYNSYIHPSSPTRAKLSVYLLAQATSDVSTKQISELVKALDLGSEKLRSQAATDLQARLSAAEHDRDQEVAGLRDYLLHDLKVAEGKIDAAVEAWGKISRNGGQGVNGVGGSDKDATPPTGNGTEPVVVEDVRAFKASLQVSAGARPVRDLSEFEELDSKL